MLAAVKIEQHAERVASLAKHLRQSIDRLFVIGNHQQLHRVKSGGEFHRPWNVRPDQVVGEQNVSDAAAG